MELFATERGELISPQKMAVLVVGRVYYLRELVLPLISGMIYFAIAEEESDRDHHIEWRSSVV